MGQAGLLGSITYEIESSMAEDVDTTNTLEFPHLGPVDVTGFVHNRIAPDRTKQRLNEGSTWILGTMEGTFKTRSYLTGHGSSTAGAVTATPYEAIIANVIGAGGLVASSGTTLTGGTANIPTTTSSASHSAGGLAFVGALNDGDGNGQAYAIASHSGNNLTLLTNLAGSPVSGAALSSGYMFYTLEDPPASVNTYRFNLQTADYQYLGHGCAPIAWSITQLGPNDPPVIEITWQVAWWEYKAVTFPNTTTKDTNNPATNAAGTLWVNDKGTVTNATREIYNFEYTVTGGMEVVRGTGGVNPYQTIIRYVRTPAEHQISWVEAAGSATTTPTVPGWDTAKHVLLTLSTFDGKRVGMYWANVCPSGPKPTQFVDSNLTRIRFTGMAYTNTVTTSALTLSAFRMLWA